MSIYRLMAQTTADLVCQKLGIHQPCTTDQVPLRAAVPETVLRKARAVLPDPAVSKAYRRLGKDLAQVVESIERDPYRAEIVCDCELVSRAEVDTVLQNSAAVPVRTLADISRRTRLGFGPCQGTFCTYKAMLAGFQSGKWDAAEASRQLEEFLQERRKGQQFLLQGTQDEQTSINHKLYDVAFAFGNIPK